MDATKIRHTREVYIPRLKADLAEHVLAADRLAVQIAEVEEQCIAAEEAAAFGSEAPAPAGDVSPASFPPVRSENVPAAPENKADDQAQAEAGAGT